MTRKHVSIACAASLAMAGCSYHVKVNYLKPRQPPIPQSVLSNVYLVIERPDVPDVGSMTKSGFQSVQDLPLELDLDPYAAAVAYYLKIRGGRLTAYRVKGKREELFEEGIQPTSLLLVHLETPLASESKGKEEETKEVDGKKQTVEVTYWKTQTSLSLDAKLLTYPDRTLICEDKQTLETSERFNTAGGSSLQTRYTDQLNHLLKSAAKWTTNAVIPIDVITRDRTLFTVTSSTAAKHAVQQATKDKWEEGLILWKQFQTQNPTDWRPDWNLAVAAETKREYANAKSLFADAERKSAGDANAPKADSWQQIYRDLEAPMPMTVSEPDHSLQWFGQRVVVLPFSDESTSVDGPVNVRRLTRDALSKYGYNAVPLTEVDEILRQNGFTQGGQLTATTPEQLSKWLKADLLVFGHLEKFDEFTLGIFGWKRITGTFKIWQAARNDYLWISQKKVSRLSAMNGKSAKDIGWSFLQQLAGSWLDKATHKPMSEESIYYVNEQLAELPKKPNDTTRKPK